MAELRDSLTRTTAFVRKEIAEILRQPRLGVSLVLGPFLVLLLFGVGLRDEDPALRTAFVAPRDPQLREVVDRYAARLQGRLDVVEGTLSEDEALAALRAGDLQLVVVFPEDPVGAVRSGVHAPLLLYHDQYDPVESLVVDLLSRRAADQVNAGVLGQIVSAGQEEAALAEQRLGNVQTGLQALRLALIAGDRIAAEQRQGELSDEALPLALLLAPLVGVLEQAEEALAPATAATVDAEQVSSALTGLEELVGVDDLSALAPDDVRRVENRVARVRRGVAEFRSVPPELIVSPFTGGSRRVTGGDVDLTDFYAPAVVVLLLQHLVVTFMALSLVRDEALGITDVFRVAPLRPIEVLVGKYLAFILLGAVAATALIGLLVLGLGLPVAAPAWQVGAGVLLVLLASAGVGGIIALVANSDTQAVQYAMLVLLASIFLGGFLLSLERLTPAVRSVTEAIPATHGIELLRGLLLRGTTGGGDLIALGLMATALFAGSATLLQRRLSRSG